MRKLNKRSIAKTEIFDVIGGSVILHLFVKVRVLLESTEYPPLHECCAQCKCNL